MYKNFSLTDEERKTILEQHKLNGYKSSLRESFDDNEMDINPDDYKQEPLKIPKNENLESYYILGMGGDDHYTLLGGDSSQTFSFSNLNWLGRNGYRKFEFNDVDDMFSKIEGIGKHFSSNPEISKITAETMKKHMGGKPFVVWSKDLKRGVPMSRKKSENGDNSNWFKDKDTMSKLNSMSATDRYIRDINKS